MARRRAWGIVTTAALAWAALPGMAAEGDPMPRVEGSWPHVEFEVIDERIYIAPDYPFAPNLAVNVDPDHPAFAGSGWRFAPLCDKGACDVVLSTSRYTCPLAFDGNRWSGPMAFGQPEAGCERTGQGDRAEVPRISDQLMSFTVTDAIDTPDGPVATRIEGTWTFVAPQKAWAGSTAWQSWTYHGTFTVNFVASRGPDVGSPDDAPEEVLAPTTTVVRCDRDMTDTVNARLRCTALVTSTGGAVSSRQPTGTVSWTSQLGGLRSGLSCNLVLPNVGVPQCVVEFVANPQDAPIGTDLPITASYSGDDLYAPSEGRHRLDRVALDPTAPIDATPESPLPVRGVPPWLIAVVAGVLIIGAVGTIRYVDQRTPDAVQPNAPAAGQATLSPVDPTDPMDVWRKINEQRDPVDHHLPSVELQPPQDLGDNTKANYETPQKGHRADAVQPNAPATVDAKLSPVDPTDPMDVWRKIKEQGDPLDKHLPSLEFGAPSDPGDNIDIKGEGPQEKSQS